MQLLPMNQDLEVLIPLSVDLYYVLTKLFDL